MPEPAVVAAIEKARTVVETNSWAIVVAIRIWVRGIGGWAAAIIASSRSIRTPWRRSVGAVLLAVIAGIRITECVRSTRSVDRDRSLDAKCEHLLGKNDGWLTASQQYANDSDCCARACAD